jgi:hypothetical protein
VAGFKRTIIHGQILAQVNTRHAMLTGLDATGVEVRLASFLEKAQGYRLIAAVFSGKLKSDLGWNSPGRVNTGRYRDYFEDEEPDRRQLWCLVEIRQHETRRDPGQSTK